MELFSMICPYCKEEKTFPDNEHRIHGGGGVLVRVTWRCYAPGCGRTFDRVMEIA